MGIVRRAAHDPLTPQKRVKSKVTGVNLGHEEWSVSELEQYHRSARRVCLVLLAVLVALFISLPARAPSYSASDQLRSFGAASARRLIITSIASRLSSISTA